MGLMEIKDGAFVPKISKFQNSHSSHKSHRSTQTGRIALSCNQRLLLVFCQFPEPWDCTDAELATTCPTKT